ncbi:MAG: hypothetical protein ACHQ6T_13975 [Myxococcota bacterium]
MTARRRIARVIAALAGLARGFVGLPAHAHRRATAEAARGALADAAARRGRCC